MRLRARRPPRPDIHTAKLRYYLRQGWSRCKQRDRARARMDASLCVSACARFASCASEQSENFAAPIARGHSSPPPPVPPIEGEPRQSGPLRIARSVLMGPARLFAIHHLTELLFRPVENSTFTHSIKPAYLNPASRPSRSIGLRYVHSIFF